MTKEQIFWTWFSNNEAHFFFLNQINDDHEKERILDKLLFHLHLYNENLFFEVGGHPNEKQDLIITAAGNENIFPIVENLVEQAPSLKFWNIIALKQPVAECGIVKYGAAILNPLKMFFKPLKNEGSNQIGLRIYVENYDVDDRDNFLNAASLVVENILGEKSNALDIGYIELAISPPINETENMLKVTDLKKYVEWKKSRPSV